MLRVVVFCALAAQSALGGQPLCGEEERVLLAVGAAAANSSIEAHGLTFGPGTFWRQGGNTFGCPCQLKPCLRRCLADGKLIFFANSSCLKYFYPTFMVTVMTKNKHFF